MNCSICLRKTRKNRMNTPCGHTFHGHCMSQWTGEQGKNTCPLCRATGMKHVVLRGVTDAAVRLKNAIYDFEDIVLSVPEMRKPLPRGVFNLQFLTNEHRVIMRVILRAVFLVPHKPVQDAFMNVVVMKRTMETKAVKAGIDINRVYRVLFGNGNNNKVIDTIDNLSFVLYKNPLLVSPDANKTIVKPDFRYLKKLVTTLFYDNEVSDITQELIKARKAWKKRN